MARALQAPELGLVALVMHREPGMAPVLRPDHPAGRQGPELEALPGRARVVPVRATEAKGPATELVDRVALEQPAQKLALTAPDKQPPPTGART